MSAGTDHVLVFAHIGDLHITDAKQPNFRDFLSIASPAHPLPERARDGSDAASIGAWPETASSPRSSAPTATASGRPDSPSSCSSEPIMSPHVITWIIAAAATAGVILRPGALPEAIWAVAGAAAIVIFGLLPWASALKGIADGTDVYLFLIGMMLLSEVARETGLFDWLAAVATRRAKGSATKLFTLIYAVGTVVTVFLSNDATAVVLTPAVAAAIQAAKVEKPLPYLFICALIANAASFVLPISNPANLVIYGSHMPPLLQWLPRFAIPSILSILATYLVLRWIKRSDLRQEIAPDIEVPQLSTGAKTAAAGIAVTAVVLLTASGFDLQLGLPTFVAGIATAAITLLVEKQAPWQVLKGISWAVLPLVAGLFVLVEALGYTGVLKQLAALLHDAARQSATATAWAVGTGIAIVSNAVNNLPAGLVAGGAVHMAQVPDRVTNAVLIGVDLGPNLSVTGSLATILWLTALRREGHDVSAVQFLKVGILVMPPALILALGGAMLFG